jgi:flagellar basal-body rod modification protein FlgD
MQMVVLCVAWNGIRVSPTTLARLLRREADGTRGGSCRPREDEPVVVRLSYEVERMSTIGASASASDMQMDYMRLLVTQLQNQNPLEPMDNSEMTAQLTQFSQLQQLEGMNTSFGRVLESVQRSYASSLIGREVSFKATAMDGAIETRTGQVQEVVMGKDGRVTLVVGDQQVDLADVVSIRQ